MARPKLTLYVDVVSPFGYQAYYITRNAPLFQQVDITYVPILLGGLMRLCDNRTPLEIKNKDKWINIERRRTAKTFKIPMLSDTPKPFPQSTVNTQRALCAIARDRPDQLPAALDALYRAFWVDGRTIGKVEEIRAALGRALSPQQVEAAVGGIGDADVKKALTANTEAAFNEGAFGLPWFVVEKGSGGEKEAFWGVDHIGQVIDELGLKREGDGLKALL